MPVGIVSVVLSVRLLPADTPPSRTQAFDFRGLALLGPGLALLVYGLSQAGEVGSFAQPKVWPTILIAVVLLALFVLYAGRRGERALIPLTYFRDRAFAGASVVSLVLGMTIFGVMLLLPLYYQQVRAETALTAGLLLAPQGLGTALAMPIAGKLTDTHGPRRVVLVGTVLITVSTAALTQLTTGSSGWFMAGVLIIRGLGFGTAMMPAMAAGYRNLPPAASGHASSVLQIFSRVGGTLGAALMMVILTQRLDHTPTDLSSAYTATFWWATAITAAGVVFALLLPGIPARKEPDHAAPAPVGLDGNTAPADSN